MFQSAAMIVDRLKLNFDVLCFNGDFMFDLD